MRTTKAKKGNYSIPGKRVTKGAFKVLVIEAEEGPFLTVEESKKTFLKWRNSRK